MLIIVRDDLRRIYVWKGAKTQTFFFRKSSPEKIAQELQKELIDDPRYHRCKIESFKQGDEFDVFLKALKDFQVYEYYSTKPYIYRTGMTYWEDMYNLLRVIIAKGMNISLAAASGLLRLAIKDEFGPLKLVKQLNFEDFRAVLRNSLPNRLMNLEARADMRNKAMSYITSEFELFFLRDYKITV